ncbi:MAG TPA: hypothetical protein PLW72_14385 [Burkholderiaceae bacterium]|nr:hypothetical protein [Burkholderiaceae bacterium]HQR76744.1 hypothetical protein [Burkholderiaceae bacterium]
MRDNDSGAGCAALGTGDPARQAERLVALAREARLLEFALEGESEIGRRLATELEAALELAMDAESPEELMTACASIEAALEQIVSNGMQLSAQMADMEVDGVLGTARMPVLTAVLSAS